MPKAQIFTPGSAGYSFGAGTMTMKIGTGMEQNLHRGRDSYLIFPDDLLTTEYRPSASLDEAVVPLQSWNVWSRRGKSGDGTDVVLNQIQDY